MATTYRATITFNVWKQHTCVHCDGKFRYLLKRVMTGTGSTERAASAAAEANVLRAISTEVDQHPCPTCGLYQPDMVAVTRGRAHLWVFLGFLVACAIPIIAGFVTDWAWYVPWLAAALAAVALVGHLIVDSGNPNRQPQSNLEIARQRVENGEVFPTTAGDSLAAGNEATGAAWRPAGQIVLYGLFAAGILALPAGEVLRLVKHWPTNAEWRPHITGPGDKPYIYFPTKISSVKGYWSATGEATVLNAAELGVPQHLRLTSKTSSWGDSISVKDAEKDNSSTLYAWVELPNDPKLEGKTLQIEMNMLVTYPKAQINMFIDSQQNATYTAKLAVAESRAGAMYTQWYWLGLLGGLAITLVASLGIMKRAGSVRSQALPTEIHIPGSDSDNSSPPPNRSSDQIQE